MIAQLGECRKSHEMAAVILLFSYTSFHTHRSTNQSKPAKVHLF